MPPKLHQLQSVIAHEGSVNCVSLGEKTSQIFVSGGADCMVNLWQIGNNNPKVCFGPFQYSITAVKLSADEERLLIGLDNGTVVLYDLNDNKCISTWTQNRSSITSLSFSAANPEIAIASDRSGKLVVLSTSQRKALQAYSDHVGPINNVCVSHDGVFCASCGDDRNVHVYDLTQGKHVMVLSGHIDSIYDCCFHPTEPMIVTCGADRSIRFFDMNEKTEIPNDLCVDSAPVEKIKFHPENQIVVTCSSDYLKFVSTQPPFQITDLFAIALETIKDIAVNGFNITIASSVGDQLMIHRTKVDYFKPFKNRPVSLIPDLDPYGNPKVSPSQAPPRLLDIAVMPVPTRNRIASKPKSRNKEENDQLPSGKSHLKSPISPARSPISSGKSSGKSTVSRYNKVGSKAKPTFPNVQNDYLDNPAFAEFRKNRASFMTKMNDRFSRLTRINDMIGSQGLTKTLESASRSGDLGPELLTILRTKPECVKFEHSVLILQICDKIYSREKDLCIYTIESLLQAYGRLVVDILSNKNSKDEAALAGKVKNATKFAELFKKMAPFLRTIAISQSTSASTAAELIDEWQELLK